MTGEKSIEVVAMEYALILTNPNIQQRADSLIHSGHIYNELITRLGYSTAEKKIEEAVAILKMVTV